MAWIKSLRVVLVAGLLAAMPLAGCQTVPATGERQFILLSESEEIQIGEEAAPQFREEGGGEVESAAVREYVAELGQRIAMRSERPDLPWEFSVLDSEQINAFALPGGKVFVTRGLISRFDNEAQLAGVLGHEIGHVTGMHINQQLSRAMATEGLLQVAGAATESQWIEMLGGVGGQLYMLSFSRGQESQADQLGLRYMTELGYDPRGMLQVLEILAAESGGGGIEWLQTHPLPQTRIDSVREMIAQEYAHTQDSPEYELRPEPFEQNVLAPLGAR